MPLSVTLILLAQPIAERMGRRVLHGIRAQGRRRRVAGAGARGARRIGSATSGTLLKGAGRHRLVAVSNVVTAVGQPVVERPADWPVQPHGVAIGTLVPVSLCAMFVLFRQDVARGAVPWPGTCRSGRPAVWPGIVMAAFVVLSRPLWRVALVIGAEARAAVMVTRSRSCASASARPNGGSGVSEFLTLSRRPRLVAAASERA